MAPLTVIPRNMVIVREGRELALINSVRLSPGGEAELERLGRVRHLVKLGAFHTRDDPYYRHRYLPTFWAPRPRDPQTRALGADGASPLARARPFVFERARRGEAALVLDQPGGALLVTCDSAQPWRDTAGCSLVGGVACHALGFLRRPVTIGPMWLKQMSEGDPARLVPDFDRLLAMDFAHLIAGHGALLRDVARAELAASWQAARDGRGARARG
jgi:hypothetical protein